jgi:hypothetical protein
MHVILSEAKGPSWIDASCLPTLRVLRVSSVTSALSFLPWVAHPCFRRVGLLLQAPSPRHHPFNSRLAFRSNDCHPEQREGPAFTPRPPRVSQKLKQPVILSEAKDPSSIRKSCLDLRLSPCSPKLPLHLSPVTTCSQLFTSHESPITTHQPARRIHSSRLHFGHTRATKLHAISSSRP